MPLKQEVSIERVVELSKLGLNASQIAERVGRKPCTIYAMLRDHIRSTPEAAAADKARLTCGCGGPKWGKSPKCKRCRMAAGARR